MGVDKNKLNCRNCGDEKRRTKKGKPYCLRCQSDYSRANKVKIQKYRKQWGIDNKEHLISYREENSEHIKEQRRKWGEDNKEHTIKYHRKYNREKRHPDYPVWISMKSRCYNSNSRKYPRYGGRGIVVCDRWLNSFETFISDMGQRPEPRFKYSIERDNVDGNYEPGNCRWATAKEQARNKSNSRFVEYNGEQLPLAEVAERMGISYGAALYKFKKTIDETQLLEFEGERITLKELSLRTKIDLRIVLIRATRNLNVEFITASFRGTPTYLYKECRYTIMELSMMLGINQADLFHLLYRNNKSPEDIEKYISK